MTLSRRELVERLVDRYAGRIALDEPLSRHTSFRIGGPADALVTLDSEEEIASLLRWSQACRIPVVVIGNGTNLLVADAGFAGIVLKVATRAVAPRFDGPYVIAPAGLSVSALARLCAESGLGGLEFAAGIPGTLGGAVAMNAGAWGGSMADVLVDVRALGTDGEPLHLQVADLGLAYRSSLLLQDFHALTEARLHLVPRPRGEVMDRMREYQARRRTTQPMDLPSAGSVFRNPPGDSAGRLIDGAGCKGLRVGDAVVADVHANFVVNAGHATAADVAALVSEVARRVMDVFGVAFETEIAFLGEFPELPAGRQLCRSCG